ncbi:MAG: tetratricopeptide repeat protein [Candidatus Binatia bacterium]
MSSVVHSAFQWALHVGRTRPQLLAGAAVATLAGLVYVNALANGLVWDDPIVLGRQLLAFGSIDALLFPPRNIPQFIPDYYRPLTVLSYLADRTIGGTGPFMFHFSVVLYHVLTTYLVFRLGWELFAGGPAALLAAGLGAALFAVHPIHTESVAWGAGRSDVLACCFSVAAAVVYLRDPFPSLPRASGAAALLFAGMLAKETAVALLVILPAGDWVLGRHAAWRERPASRAARRAARRPLHAAAPATRGWVLVAYAPLAVAGVLYATLRQVALGSFSGPTALPGDGLAARMIAAVGVYIGKLLLPVHQSAYISDLPTSPLGLLGAGTLIVAATLAGVFSWRRRGRRVTFLLVWVAATLAPSLAIVVKIPAAPVAERYLYLPSVGFCLLAGYGAARMVAAARANTSRAAALAVVAVTVATASVATIRRNRVWRSNLSLWQDTVAKNTTDGLPMRSLATAYQQRGDAAKARRYFQLALQRRNDQVGRFTVYNNLGSLAMAAERLDDAERYYQTALRVNPHAPECLYNLGLIGLTRALDTKKTPEIAERHSQALRARRFFERAAYLSPLDPDIHVGLGQTLSALGDTAGARAQYTRALDLGLAAGTERAVRKLLAELSAHP